MPIDIAAIGSRLAVTLLAALKGGGSKAKVLAEAEAQKLATSIATIGELFAAGQIDAEEAKVLLRIQRDASESVLASLAETSRLAVHRAITAGLEELARGLGASLGTPLRTAMLSA